jgi:hypothetical protein
MFMQSLCGLAIECSGFIVFFGERKKKGWWMQKANLKTLYVVKKIQKLQNIFFKYSGHFKKFTIRKHVRAFLMFQLVCLFPIF